VRHTLLNRGLYRQRKDGGVQEVSWRRTFLLRDLGIVAFQVDTLRLPVKIEQLLNTEVTHQMQASLGGRQVRVTNSRGLAISIRLEPEEPKPKVRLPKRASLDLDTRPEGAHLIPIGLGTGGPVWRSLLKTGHILLGGESGSGKSTWLNAMLIALLDAHTPEELRVAIIDPKQVEFQAYRGIPHLFDDAPVPGQRARGTPLVPGTGVAVEVDQAEALLARLIVEMDRRRALFASVGAKSLKAYNHKVHQADSVSLLPLILLVIDEVTDIALLAGLKSSFYTDLIRLVSKGRAFGLAVILATQNPKAEVLNTLIRGNMSTRIAFRVATTEHSKTILGIGGAQELPRTIRGRMLARLDGKPVTLQGFYLSDDEVAAFTARLRSQPPQVLTDLERELVRYAVEHLDGGFNTNRLWPAFQDRIGRQSLLSLARRWEHTGWLAAQPGVNTPRRVTEELTNLVGIDNDEG